MKPIVELSCGLKLLKMLFVVTRPLSGLLLGGLAVLGAAGYLVLRRARPDALAGIGVYDETTTGDVLFPHRGAA